MPETPTPQMVAEARVDKSSLDNGWYRVTANMESPPVQWFGLTESGSWSPLPTSRWIDGGPRWFPDEPSARTALAQAQEAAGCYARPRELNLHRSLCDCACVRLAERGNPLPNHSAIHTHETDRRWIWVYDMTCPNCLRGVPRTQQPPGGEQAKRLRMDEAVAWNALQATPDAEPPAAVFCPQTGTGTATGTNAEPPAALERAAEG